jgi:hypothetical protein
MAPLGSILTRLDEGRGPLNARDLWAPEAYASARDQLRGELIALKSARRLSVGDACSLVFESRATVWFQVQEELHLVRTGHEAHARELCARYACLIPRPGELCASLFLECGEPGRARELSRCLAEHLHALCLHFPRATFAAQALEPLESGIQGVAFLRFGRVHGGAQRFRPMLSWSAPGYLVWTQLPGPVAHELTRQLSVFAN